MINLTQVSLRQAREDCGISGSGGLKNVQEFKDRLGAGNGVALGDYTLKDLAGTVACKSTNVTLGNYVGNYNPGSSCRPNWSEANVFSKASSLSAELTLSGRYFKIKAAGRFGEYAYAGHSFVGRVPAGSANYRVDFSIYVSGSWNELPIYELIGWPSGYFSGTPIYYDQQRGQNVTGSTIYTINGSATPYITGTLQNIANWTYSNNTTTSRFLMTRV